MTDIERLRRIASYCRDEDVSVVMGAVSEIERLRGEIERVRTILAHTDMGSLPNDFTLEQLAEARIDDMLKLREQVRDTCKRAEKAADEIERLTAEMDAQRKEIERLRAALQWLMKQPWKSIDKDNMEFQVTVTCYVRDAMLAALEPKP